MRDSALTGCLLLLAYLVQYGLALDWGELSKWQKVSAFKIATGFGLAAFILSQWLLALCRSAGWSHWARQVYGWHVRLGSFTPLLLFVHSTKLGFGYIFLLGVVYLANAAVGLASPQALPALKRYQTPWMATHVALSLLLVVLAVYHAWTALYFE